MWNCIPFYNRIEQTNNFKQLLTTIIAVQIRLTQILTEIILFARTVR